MSEDVAKAYLALQDAEYAHKQAYLALQYAKDELERCLRELADVAEGL